MNGSLATYQHPAVMEQNPFRVMFFGKFVRRRKSKLVFSSDLVSTTSGDKYPDFRVSRASPLLSSWLFGNLNNQGNGSSIFHLNTSIHLLSYPLCTFIMSQWSLSPVTIGQRQGINSGQVTSLSHTPSKNQCKSRKKGPQSDPGVKPS